MLALRKSLRLNFRDTIRQCSKFPSFGNSSNQRASVISNVEDEDKQVSKTIIDKIPLWDNVHRKTLSVFTRQSPNWAHFNLQDLTDDMQCSFCKNYVKELSNNLRKHEITRISFNNLSEYVFRYHVNMQMRKLGYTSVFTRYNGDRGLAEFNFVRTEDY